MKLSWRDLINTALAIFGGAIVYAKFYDYSWAVIGSWRSAVAVIGITGLVMALLSGFDLANYSILNIVEMILGAAAIVLGVWGVLVASSVIFYALAGTLGALWLIDTARHAYHSLSGASTTTYHHQPVH